MAGAQAAGAPGNIDDDGDDLNDRDGTINLQSAELITNSLLDITSESKQRIGDEGISMIQKPKRGATRISAPEPYLPISPLGGSVGNPFAMDQP